VTFREEEEEAFARSSTRDAFDSALHALDATLGEWRSSNRVAVKGVRVVSGS
jgi:hypothetical protein